ncbi:hypothetical protein HGRIS_002947 [Hohenbuehelia grisea]|uniref:PIG-U-domain-containing protein n=1 Tax=Hohenbuehelia grisea TaxID=104357 RepID=A0ABR3JMZ6_9AGAR
MQAYLPARQFGATFTALAAGRLLLALAWPLDSLLYDQQLSSPLTSYLSLQEGLYLFSNGVDPYDGGSFRHSPLLLSFFSTILPSSRIGAQLLWTLADSVSALCLVTIWRARQRVPYSSRDAMIASLYLLNPYLFMPSLALSTSTLENTLTLVSLALACRQRPSQALLVLSFLTQLSLSSILLLPPLLLLLITDHLSHLASPKSFNGSLKRTLPLLGEFSLYFVSLTFASTVSAGSWKWMLQTWGASLNLPDLSPNPGMWWYFFTEMFDHFRPFFLMVFSVHLLIYVAPICIKFQHDPLYAAFILLGTLATFKPYPTLSDPGLFLTMVTLFPEVYPYFRHPIVTALLHLHASLLLPLFNRLWLTQGTGNANFFYASTLVFACSNGAALVDCIWAGLRIAIGEDKEGYHVVQE